jgi:hypothetical protein
VIGAFGSTVAAGTESSTGAGVVSAGAVVVSLAGVVVSPGSVSPVPSSPVEADPPW